MAVMAAFLLLLASLGLVPVSGDTPTETFTGYLDGASAIFQVDGSDIRCLAMLNDEAGVITIACDDGRTGSATFSGRAPMWSAYGTLDGEPLTLVFG